MVVAERIDLLFLKYLYISKATVKSMKIIAMAMKMFILRIRIIVFASGTVKTGRHGPLRKKRTGPKWSVLKFFMVRFVYLRVFDRIGPKRKSRLFLCFFLHFKKKLIKKSKIDFLCIIYKIFLILYYKK